MNFEKTVDLPDKILLLHEWFTPRSVGGAEKVVEKIDHFLSEIGHRPDLAALVDGQSSFTGNWLSGRPVQTSFIQHLAARLTSSQESTIDFLLLRALN